MDNFDLPGFVARHSETILSCVVALPALVAAAFATAWLYRVVDTAFRPVRTSPGMVVSRGHSPPLTTITLVPNGSNGVMQFFSSIPSGYQVTVRRLADRDHQLSVSRKDYEAATAGKLVTVSYVIGRLTGRTHIRSFR